MFLKKIRSHKRIWKDIDSWVNNSKNLDIENLKQLQRDYTKVRVYPYTDTSNVKSVFPQPKGITRLKILEGLVTIYESWQQSLEKLNEPYYLKIWLYEPYLTHSQIICAIGDFICFYDTTFFKPALSKTLNPKNYGALEEKMKTFNWEYYYDEEHLDKTTLGQPEDYYSQEEFEREKKWFDNKLKKPHRITKYDEPYGDATEGYSFKRGVVWIGEKFSVE